MSKTKSTASAKEAFTVVFYIDGDYGVETFVQEVKAKDAGSAFDKAVKKARKDGGTSSGRSLNENDWQNATEIVTFLGHDLDAYQQR